MTSGYTSADNRPSSTSDLAVQAAGVWTTPGGGCSFSRTDTFCTGLVLWCKEVYVCNNDTLFGYEETKTPYPCGVCVGVSDPSDW